MPCPDPPCTCEKEGLVFFRGGWKLVISDTRDCAISAWDLSATKAVDEAIKKAKRAFFAYGAMGAFQGKLNPLSGKTIFNTCRSRLTIWK